MSYLVANIVQVPKGRVSVTTDHNLIFINYTKRDSQAQSTPSKTRFFNFQILFKLVDSFLEQGKLAC